MTYYQIVEAYKYRDAVVGPDGQRYLVLQAECGHPHPGEGMVWVIPYPPTKKMAISDLRKA